MIRKNKKFIDPRYFMDEKMETVSEGGTMGHAPGKTQFEVMKAAGLGAGEISFVVQILDNQIDFADFYGTPAYDKLFELLAFDWGEMPYGTAKARDGMPDEWILDYLEGL